MFLKHFFCTCAVLHEELVSQFDFKVFDDLQFGCCISCNFCPMRMNSFFFRVFRLKEAENNQQVDRT